ncbi:MAG: hypothetical protein ACR2NZ_08315, partial [Rubripirellula sp.]
MIAAFCLAGVLLMQLAIMWGDPSPSATFSLRLMQIAIVAIGVGVVSIRRNRKSVLARCLLSLAMLLCCLASAEWLLGALSLTSSPTSGWRSHCGKTERNELGFRGQSFTYSDDEFVVVLLGDSQVEAAACEFDRMPERLLESSLREQSVATRVVSLGTSGYGQDQELLALREYFERGFRADLVILWQTLENDVWNNTFPTHWPTNANPKPTFLLLDGSLSLHRTPTAFQSEESPINLLRMVRNLVPQRIDDAWERTVLPAAYHPRNDPSLPRHDEWQSALQKRVDQGDNLRNDKHHLSLFLEPASPRVDYGIRLTRALYREIEKESNAHGARFLLFNAVREPETLFTKYADVYYHSEEGTYHFAKSQRNKAATMLAEGFQSIPIEVTTVPFWVSENDAHLNPKAVEQVMDDLASELITSQMIESTGTPSEPPDPVIDTSPA